jgi:hypothetical protein
MGGRGGAGDRALRLLPLSFADRLNGFAKSDP